MALQSDLAAPDPNVEETHRRVRKAAIGTYWVFPLYLFVLGLWSFFRFFACDIQTFDGFWPESFCEKSYLAPLFLVGLLLFGAAIIVREIWRYGSRMDPIKAQGWSASKRGATRVKGGYRGISRSHRAHVRWNVFIWFVATASFVGLRMFYSEASTKKVLITVILILVTGIVAWGTLSFRDRREP